MGAHMRQMRINNCCCIIIPASKWQFESLWVIGVLFTLSIFVYASGWTWNWNGTWLKWLARHVRVHAPIPTFLSSYVRQRYVHLHIEVRDCSCIQVLFYFCWIKMADKAHPCPCTDPKLPQFNWVSTVDTIAGRGKRLPLCTTFILILLWC